MQGGDVITNNNIVSGENMQYLKIWTCIVLAGLLSASAIAAQNADGQEGAGPSQGNLMAEPSMTTLQDTIKATLQHHRGLRVIQENRDVIVHELQRARAGWGPRADVNGRAGYSQLSDTTTRPLGADEDFYGETGIGLTLVQPLWDGLATRSRVRTAEATLDSMTNRVFDNATTLGLDGIIAHIDLIRRREIYRLAQENVRRHQEILASSKDRQQLGADTMADVTQTEGRLSRALSTLSEAKASLLQGEDAYRRVTGLPVPLELGPVALPDPMYENSAVVFEEAQKHNPKLLAYLDDIRAAVGERELAKSAFHPMINLEGGPQYTDRQGPGNQWTQSLEIMATLRWNIFNSGADVAATRAALSRIRQSREYMFNFVDDLKLEIEDSWTGYMAAREQHEHYLNAIEFNRATRDAYLEQFVLGQRSLLDVLDAESELFNSSTQAATAQGNILVGGFRLYALSGVLLPRLDIPTEKLNEAPREELPDPAWSFTPLQAVPVSGTPVMGPDSQE